MTNVHKQSPTRNPPPAPDMPAGTTVVGEYALNHHQTFRAEIINRSGRPVVSLSRWKNSGGVNRRTGQAFEFGAHRIHAVLRLLSAVAQTIQSQQPFFEGAEADLADDESLSRDAGRLLSTQRGAQ